MICILLVYLYLCVFVSVYLYICVSLYLRIDNIGLYSSSSGLSPVSDDLTEYLKPAGVALIVGGLVIVAVAVIGYCGTSSDIKIFLIVVCIMYSMYHVS